MSIDIEDWLASPYVKRAAAKIGWSPYQSEVTVLDLLDQVRREMDELEEKGFTPETLREAAGDCPLPEFTGPETFPGLHLRLLKAQERETFVKHHPELSSAQVADALGVSLSAADRYRQKAGSTERRAALRAEQIAERMAYIEAHPKMMGTELAETLGISMSAVSRMRKALREGTPYG